MSLQDPQRDPKHSQRLLWAVALSGLILLGFDLASTVLLGKPLMSAPLVSQTAAPVVSATTVTAGVPASGAASPSEVAPVVRLPLANNRVSAAVNLRGGRLDMLTLRNYKTEIKDPAGFTFLKPEGDHAEYIAAGWQGAGIAGPDENSAWQREADVADDGKRVVLVWRNTTGQSFQREMVLQPDSYVVRVTERVVNGAALPVSLSPFVQVHRADGYWPLERSSWVNYFGPMGVTTEGGEALQHETSFASLKKEGKSTPVLGTGGWWGMTNQYFMAAVLPGQVNGKEAATTRQFRHATLPVEAGLVQGKPRDIYTASVAFEPVVVPSGGSAEVTYALYVGPKHYDQLQAAGHELTRAIYWGWFEPMVKGLYYVLALIHDYVPNWGLAVIVLTILLKIATFPLANKSYHAMAKMKKLQPQMEALKERYKDDQAGMATAMMEMYKKAKVNPLSGCWPMLIQIPIFFAMYKVVLVMFEFRHAELGLWIVDLSAMDPWFVLPVLMGISMWVQFKLNPAPTDPTQAAVFKWMPLLMTVMFLWFPAGLVLYWLTNNVLSIGQQYFIMKRDKAL